MSMESFRKYVALLKQRQGIKRKVFLGGTYGESNWRQEIIDGLTIDYFNPIVDDWDEKAQKEEIKQRNTCDFVLYVITPEMKGVYSIAEVADDSNKRPEKTVFCFLETEGDLSFNEAQIKSLNSVGKMIEENGAKWCKNLDEVVTFLNEGNPNVI